MIANGERFRGNHTIDPAAGDGSLQITYTALSFVDPEKIAFRYRLRGENDGWVDAGTRRTAFYTHLDPGTYEFIVEARTSEGVWSEIPASIRITLPPLLHQTLWFRLLSAIAILGAVLGLHRLRLARLSARNRALNREIVARKESEAKHRALAETAGDAILIVGPKRSIEYVNGAAVNCFGLSDAEAARSLPLHELLLSAGPENSLDQLFTEDGSIALALEGHRVSGGRFPVEVSSGRMDRGDGTQAHVLIVRDVTERQRLEHRLAESSKLEAIGRLTGGIAHDFNNILTALMGHASMLEEDLEDEAQLGVLLEHTGHIKTSTHRATSLVQQLLTFARRRVVDPGIIDPNETIRQLEPMLRRLIPECIELELDLAQQPGHVFVDAHELERVLVNLVVNAKDAIDDKGTITLATGSDGATEIEAGVTISVRDTGCGLSSEELTRIFEPFYTTKPVGKGTGLGLAAAYGFAEQAGGHIAVKSAPGKGTCFVITLPLVEGETVTTDEVPETPTAATGREGDGRTILLCDDEDMVRETTAAVLRKAGYRVLGADLPSVALQLFRAHEAEIDALVTDVVMPEMDGHQLAARLLELRPELPVLYISGYSSDTDWVGDPRAINLLAKPFSPDQLVRRVHALFSGTRT